MPSRHHLLSLSLSLSLSLLGLLLGGCASAPPLDPMETWRNPEFQEQWNRCVRDSGESSCTASFRKTEQSNSGTSLVTEGQFVHKNTPPEKTVGKESTLVVITEPEKPASEKVVKPQAKPPAKPERVKPPAKAETSARPAAPRKQPVPQPAVITADSTKPCPPQKRTPQPVAITGEAAPATSVTLIPCTEEEKRQSQQLQENIDALRGSLREWLNSRGDY
ncbi:hypothetical protein SIID45300_02243 [Candidatus Magnetaquicoccaceae bacterium FCR-1]|uniref:Secreted protein n=1 Tax=Candidatus Magnetaquiglobus chichijimensis TaxID=3141448 RepID=A0ABQ0CAJ2_9PROT